MILKMKCDGGLLESTTAEVLGDDPLKLESFGFSRLHA